MTPINNSSPAPKPGPPVWQRIAMGILGIGMALYLLFGIALPGFRARQAAIDGPTPQSSAPVH